MAKQTVSVRSRPTASDSQQHAMAWLLKQNKDMAQYDFSVANVTGLTNNIIAITTVVDPNSPALGAPYDMPADGSGYNYELLDGAVTPWMYDLASLLAADAHILFTITYTGNDHATLAYMQGQPTPGTLIVAAKCKITNAGGVSGWTDDAVTTSYQTIASSQEGETPPTGYAQALYTILNQLHQQGTLEITEQECSDRLPPGCVFNTSDGLAAWRTMNALVISVAEDIDNGKTTVEFGPTLHLGLQEMVELRRANRGRLLSYAMNQHDTGATSAASTIQGHNQGGASSSHLPPAVGGKPLPWAGTIKLVGGSYILQIGPGLLMLSQVQGNTVAIANLSPTTLTINQTVGSTDFAYLEVPVASLAPTGSASVNSGSAGGTFDPTKPAWDSGGKAYLADDGATPPSQTFFRVLLGTIATGAGVGGVTPAPVYTPCCVSNLLIFNCFISPEPCIMAYPTNTASS